MFNPTEASILSNIYRHERLKEAQIQRSGRHNKKITTSLYWRLAHFLIPVGLTLKPKAALPISE